MIVRTIIKVKYKGQEENWVIKDLEILTLNCMKS